MNAYRLQLAALLVLLTSHALHAAGPFTITWDEVAKPGGGAKAPVELHNGEILAALTQLVADGVEVVCFKSTDTGDTWTRASTIARDQDRNADIGDGHFLQLPNGDVLYSYRHHRFHDLPPSQHTYSIKVAVSKDNGVSWSHHSTVIGCQGLELPMGLYGSAGLWSSFLLQTERGVLQCYYDDECTPFQRGFPGHQWIQMKTWNAKASRWEMPVTVSRANNPDHLSRDGSCAVAELSENRLICALESVQVDLPHRGLIRYVTSKDGGRTWSWQRTERYVLYEPANKEYNALSPWIVRLSNGALLCVFITDEDRSVPDVPSTGVVDEDLKYVVATESRGTWSRTPGILDDGHPIRLPGVIELSYGPSKGKIFASYIRNGRVFTKTGVVVPTHAQDLPEGTVSPPDAESAARFVVIVLGEPCGNADGQIASIRNTHASRMIRVRLSKTWSNRGEAMSRESTLLLRPGDHAKRLGCSKRRVSAEEIRSFRWTILTAEFK